MYWQFMLSRFLILGSYRMTNKLILFYSLYYYNPNKPDYSVHIQFITFLCLTVYPYLTVTHIQEHA